MFLDDGQSRVALRLANHLWREGRQTRSPTGNDSHIVMRLRVAEIDLDYHRIWDEEKGGTRYEISSPKWRIIWHAKERMHHTGLPQDVLNDLTMIMLSGDLYG